MRNARGITPIISVVLLLMMTVAVAGLAWFWLQGMTSSTMGATENMTKTQMQQMLTIIDIADYGVECEGSGPSANVTNIDLQVFNKGSTSINVNSVVINGKTANISATTARQINPGSIGTLNISSVKTLIKGFNATTSKSVDILLSANEGYVKKTMNIDGVRCNP